MGANLTFIGLPKKKKCVEGLVKFLLRAAEERQRQILGWMLLSHLVEKALYGERLECNNLDKDLRLKSNLLDEMSTGSKFKGFLVIVHGL